MTAEWQGKSRGTVLGYRIFVSCIKNLGVRPAYSLLVFVSLYYYLFSPRSNRAIYAYFKERQAYSTLKSILSVYKSYFVFGQTIIDKVAIAAGLRDRFTYDFDGVDTIREVLRQGEGGLLISAHVGNFEIAEFFLAEVDPNAKISLLTTDLEHNAIKNYLESVTGKSKINLILYKEDFSHIFEIHAALSRNELVCITGDRFADGSKTMTAQLLGHTAKFPAGPFLLGQKLRVPVLFVYVMKESNLHYHLYARKVKDSSAKAAELLQAYTNSITWILKQYPNQWFNYFNFWNEQP